MNSSAFIPSKETLEKLHFIRMLQGLCESRGVKLWHCGSWAVTAMVGHFFKDLNDFDIILETKEQKTVIIEILSGQGFTFVKEFPWGSTVFTNGSFEIECGSGDFQNSIYYKAEFSEKNFGIVNGVKIYIADPEKILEARYEMIESGHKQLDDMQKFMIQAVQQYIEKQYG